MAGATCTDLEFWGGPAASISRWPDPVGLGAALAYVERIGRANIGL